MVCTYIDNYQLFTTVHFVYIDIDECLSCPCLSDFLCNNVDGSYTCDCPDGTMKNGTDCICKKFKI